uniref:MATH domain-containing protein n=1 Tax=Oryza meridionalis TaxID=40149 RepID=A0A0E0EY51_9ORYZ
MAQYQFRFLGDVGEQAPPLTLTRNKFTSWKGWGLCKFITREELERSVHLKDDTFTVRCDIVITKEFISEERTTTPSEESFVAVPPSDLQRHLGDLLHDEKGADVVFEAGGETFAAHGACSRPGRRSSARSCLAP